MLAVLGKVVSLSRENAFVALRRVRQKKKKKSIFRISNKQKARSCDSSFEQCSLILGTKEHDKYTKTASSEQQ